jgi:hypothetical protein
MPEKIRKRASLAKVAYRKVREEVERKLAEGFSLRIVYEDLTAAGRLDIGYSTFCDYVRGQGERLHKRPSKPTSAAPSRTPSRPAPKPPAPEEKPSAFIHDRHVDLKKLV